MAELLNSHEKTGKLQSFQISDNDWDLVRYVFNIESVMRKVISTSGPLYQAEIVEGGEFVRLIQAKLGEEFRELLKNSLFVMSKCRSYYKFNPYVSVFVDVANKLNLSRSRLEFDDTENVSIAIVDALRACVEELRSLGRSSDFKDNLRNYRRSASKNYSELEGYINGLFLNWPSLMVVRLELGYRWPISTERLEEEVPDDERAKGFERLVEDRIKLLKLVRKKANNRFVGFIWRLEYRPKLSYCYHLILFFDGSKVSEGLRWGEMIGKVWVKEVTQGDGVYFNFNQVESDHWYCVSDNKEHESLMRVVTYLTRPDDYLRIVKPRSARALGRGQLPRAPKA